MLPTQGRDMGKEIVWDCRAEGARVLDAVQVLRSMEGEEKPLLGRRVVIYGGGNTAIDVARTAKAVPLTGHGNGWLARFKGGFIGSSVNLPIGIQAEIANDANRGAGNAVEKGGESGHRVSVSSVH